METHRPAVRSPRASRFAFALAALPLLVTCKGDSDRGAPQPDRADGGVASEDGAAGVSRAALLAEAAGCVRAALGEFQMRATALAGATAAWAATPDPATRAAARAAFGEAMDAWQIADVMQIGPAALKKDPGGQGLRDEIYSWPYVDACEVDKALVARAWEAPAFATMSVNRRGLGAIETLLFAEGAPSSCAQAPAGFPALGADELDARRRAYASVAAGEVQRLANVLVDAWDPAKGNFARTLESAGASGNATFPKLELGVNAVSDALFYADDLKDAKLAAPAGLRPECTTATCPALLESRSSRRSKANVAANLVGFRRLAEGCGPGFSGAGFDDLLESVGASSVASALRASTASVEQAIAAIEEPDLEAALETDRASVVALWMAWKGVTDLLKLDFVNVLDLEKPENVEGDND